jgi:membrane protein required for colicin V production
VSLVALDLAILAALAIAALSGAMSGALRQVVQLLAVGAGWGAARHLAAPVAGGLARTLSPLLARSAASALLFMGVFALVSLIGGAVLKGTGVARAVRGPADRGVGGLLGGAKAGAIAWVLLSALAVAGAAAPAWLPIHPRTSQFAALAAAHNLLERASGGTAPASVRPSSPSPSP